jgi:hypothetical protein
MHSSSDITQVISAHLCTALQVQLPAYCTAKAFISSECVLINMFQADTSRTRPTGISSRISAAAPSGHFYKSVCSGVQMKMGMTSYAAEVPDDVEGRLETCVRPRC